MRHGELNGSKTIVNVATYSVIATIDAVNDFLIFILPGSNVIPDSVGGNNIQWIGDS